MIKISSISYKFIFSLFCISFLNTNLYAENSTNHLKKIIFGAGCFWSVEKKFQESYGVLNVESGYADGKNIKPIYKEIIKSYGNKAKEVSKKYIDSPISTDFACVYVPSESLYLELNTHITLDKELWISEIQKKYKVTFMGPSTFSAYCSAILLGFNSIAVDQKAKTLTTKKVKK